MSESGSRLSTPRSGPVIHLELHTRDLDRAAAFYSALCGWRPEPVESAGSTYTAIEMGDGPGGGIVECAARRPIWLPYVEVPDLRTTTERARALGATVLLDPREGPAGWRSVVATRAGGEIALWQPK